METKQSNNSATPIADAVKIANQRALFSLEWENDTVFKKRELNYKTKAAFQKDLEAGKISKYTTVFIKDSKEIYKNGQYYGSSDGSEVSGNFAECMSVNSEISTEIFSNLKPPFGTQTTFTPSEELKNLLINNVSKNISLITFNYEGENITFGANITGDSQNVILTINIHTFPLLLGFGNPLSLIYIELKTESNSVTITAFPVPFLASKSTGNSFFCDDGQFKKIDSLTGFDEISLSQDIISGTTSSGNFTEEEYNKILVASEKGYIIVNLNGTKLLSNVSKNVLPESKTQLILSIGQIVKFEGVMLLANNITIKDKSENYAFTSDTFITNIYNGLQDGHIKINTNSGADKSEEIDLIVNGDGTKFLADDGQYKTIETISSAVGKIDSNSDGTGEIFNNYNGEDLNISKGNSSHAEGFVTNATGNYSHSEGGNTSADGEYSHAEGENSIASGWYSHAEGFQTKSIGEASHAEGRDTQAKGRNTHAEGYSTIAENESSHAEGYTTKATGEASHAEGRFTEANGENSHAEGTNTKSNGISSHVEGRNGVADANYSHAEGFRTISLGEYSHAEGGGAVALNESFYTKTKDEILAEWERLYKTPTDYETGDGFLCAAGKGSHSEGKNTLALADFSHTSGEATVAKSYCQTAIGRFNEPTTSGYNEFSISNEAFVIGNGTDISSKGNAFKVLFNGQTYADGAYSGSGADYAEFFEWKDGNELNEDRVGLFVSIENDKIVKATKDSKYILGIVSGNPSVIGDNPMRWKNKYLTDKFGRPIYEEVEVKKYEKKINDNGEEEVVETIEKQKTFKINPEWDSSKEYISRESRKEWSAIGLMGKLIVRHDGTLKQGGFCYPSENGIATNSETGYYVMKVYEDTALIMFK